MDQLWWNDIFKYDPLYIPERWLPDPPPDPWEYFRDVNPEPLISIIGVLHSQRELEITSVMRVETRGVPVGGRDTELTAALVGAEGERLAGAVVKELRSQAHGGGCGGGEGSEGRYPAIVQALVPDVGRGSALVIRRGDEELWSRRPSEREPSVGAFDVSVEGDRLILRWKVESETDGQEMWAQWSTDEGRTWSALATGLRGSEADLAVALLPPGRVRVRLLAGDGFDTTASEPVDVEVPDRGPEVSILAPREGERLVAGATMRLWGAATDAREPTAEVDKASWRVDGEVVADGIDVFVTAPAPGGHRVELLVSAPGGDSVTSSSFVTVPADEGDEQGF
jgi:hypothetical protein